MLTILLTSAAFAQAPEKSDTEVIIAKETIVDFIGVEVTGNTVAPDLRIVQEWTRPKADSLIVLRTSFQTEMNHSVENVK